jgi:glycosyltransferase involved in cell wall biosynthesis
MGMGMPAIAFAIPPIRELESGTGGITLVPPLDSKLFAEAILRLAACPDERVRVGQRGKAIVMERYMMTKSMAAALERISQLTTKRQSRQIDVVADSMA